PMVNQVVQPLLREAALARLPGVLDAGDLEAAVGDHAADVRVMVVEAAQRLDDDAVDELELADVGRDGDVGEPADRPVVEPADAVHQEAFLALVADAVDDLVALLPA